MAEADLVAVVAERVGFWSALADDQGRPLTLAGPAGPLLVRASEAEPSGASFTVASDFTCAS